jgi:hypothetical protein
MPCLLQKGEGEEPNALAGWLPTRSGAAREDNDVSTKPHGARLEAVAICKINQGLEEPTNRVDSWGARRLTAYRRFVTGNSQLERALQRQLTPTFKYNAWKAQSWGAVLSLTPASSNNTDIETHTGQWCWPSSSWRSSPGSCTCAAGRGPCRRHHLGTVVGGQSNWKPVAFICPHRIIAPTVVLYTISQAFLEENYEVRKAFRCTGPDGSLFQKGFFSVISPFPEF